MYKKILIGLIATSIVFTSVNGVAFAKGNTNIKIVHNNVEQKQAVQPEIKSGTVYVPVRAIFDALQINYTFDEKTKMVKAQQGDKSIELVLNKKDAKVNGKAHKLANAVYTVNGYTFVPLRLIGETFGANISWDAHSQSVKILTAHDPKDTNANSSTQTSENKGTEEATAIKDEVAYKELQKLTTKYPDYAYHHLRYIILEKKDVSWLPYFIKKVKKNDIQEAIELAVESGNMETVDYMLTHYKSSIANEISSIPNSSLFLKAFPGNYSEQYIYLEPNKQRIMYKPTKTVEESLSMIDLLVKHGLKPKNVDLLAGIGGHTDIQIAALEKLVALGADLNASVPEMVALDETEGNIRFGRIGYSITENVNVPVIVQAYRITTWNISEENRRKFEAIVRLGGSLTLLTSSQQERAEFILSLK